jgi:hypothetical protein
MPCSAEGALMTVRAARGQLLPRSAFASASVADEDFSLQKGRLDVSVFARIRLFDSGKVHGRLWRQRLCRDFCTAGDLNRQLP